MHWIAQIVRHALVKWGYLALGVGLLGENAGLPLPGETILMLASFLAHKTHQLAMAPILAIGTGAAILGDNIGFFVGRRLGSRLLRWMRQRLRIEEDVAAATDQIRRHGRATIFCARFIVGLRTLAGPIAGALGMEWKTFLLYNALGAVTWVTVMAFAGYVFANKFHSLIDYFEKASWVISASLFAVGYFLWRRKRERVHGSLHARHKSKTRNGASGEVD